jgi:hypothetical protein
MKDVTIRNLKNCFICFIYVAVISYQTLLCVCVLGLSYTDNKVLTLFALIAVFPTLHL